MTKLNLGGGDGWNEPGWTNLDLALGYNLATSLLRSFKADSVECVYTSHCIEHLRPVDVVRLLQDVRRTLVPGGLLRIVVPDIDILADVLLNRGYEYLEQHNPHYYSTPEAKTHTLEDHIEELVGWHWFDSNSHHGDHKTIFSRAILGVILKLTGFTDIRHVDYCQSALEDFRRPAVMSRDGGMPIAAWDNPNTRAISLFMEARK